jgi:hypothetical protein
VINGRLEVPQDKVVIEEAQVVSEKQVVDEKSVGFNYPNLAKNKPKTIVAPQGLSRTQRKEWWSTLRKMYPSDFDANGNYIGFGDSPQKEESTEQKAITTALTEVRAEKQVNVPVETNFKNTGVGAGNAFTTMADHKIRASFFMGQYFPSKDSYSVLSAPAKIFEEARYIFVNKERTAEMFLAGLRKSASFSKLLNGHERVVPATVLKNGIFTDKYPVYYVTNVVTALQALGLQEIAQEKAK